MIVIVNDTSDGQRKDRHFSILWIDKEVRIFRDVTKYTKGLYDVSRLGVSGHNVCFKLGWGLGQLWLNIEQKVEYKICIVFQID